MAIEHKHPPLLIRNEPVTNMVPFFQHQDNRHSENKESHNERYPGKRKHWRIFYHKPVFLLGTSPDQKRSSEKYKRHHGKEPEANIAPDIHLKKLSFRQTKHCKSPSGKSPFVASSGLIFAHATYLTKFCRFSFCAWVIIPGV